MKSGKSQATFEALLFVIASEAWQSHTKHVIASEVWQSHTKHVIASEAWQSHIKMSMQPIL
jgi:hypothetical protein